MPRRLAAVLAAWLAVSACGVAAAREIVADLSAHAIEITAGFDGAELLLFGHNSIADDVIVIVRGPGANATVSRKERVAGIWANGAKATFPDAPGFYFVAVTDGLRAYGNLDTVLSETGLGAKYLGLPVTEAGMESDLVEEFRDALIELRSRQRLFSTEPGRIHLRDDGLFRTNVPFPAATPVGEYQVTIYHVQDGWPVEGVTTPLTVRKAGVGAFIYDFAHEYPAVYGLIAILAAAGAGWLGGVAFRRG